MAHFGPLFPSSPCSESSGCVPSRGKLGFHRISKSRDSRHSGLEAICGNHGGAVEAREQRNSIRANFWRNPRPEIPFRTELDLVLCERERPISQKSTSWKPRTSRVGSACHEHGKAPLSSSGLAPCSGGAGPLTPNAEWSFRLLREKSLRSELIGLRKRTCVHLSRSVCCRRRCTPENHTCKCAQVGRSSFKSKSLCAGPEAT